MKKSYDKPVSEIEEFITADVITTSGFGDGGYGEVDHGDEDLD